MKSLSLFVVVLALSISLVGCGGGGGGSSGGGSSGVTTPTPPVVPPAVVQNFQTAVTPTYLPASEEYGFFTAINAFRSAEGLGPLNQNAHYDLAAAAHDNYEALNFSTLGLSHGELQGSPGFTGLNPIARVLFTYGLPEGNTLSGAQTGCSLPAPTLSECVAAVVSEEIGEPAIQFIGGQTGAGVSAAAELIDSVYHRAGWMFQGATDIGVSVGTTASNPFTVSDFGYTTQQVNAGTYFGVYPLAGQGGVGLHAVQEVPTPYPVTVTSQNVASLTGYPISVASQASTALSVTTFTVTQSGSSTPMPTYPVYTDADPNLAGSTNLAFLVTSQPFLPSTVYTVHFVGTITGTATGKANGIPIDQTWSFTTGSGN